MIVNKFIAELQTHCPL